MEALSQELERRSLFPLTSKDLDVFGSRGTLEELQRRFEGVILFGAERGPVVGQLEICLGGQPRKVEVLRDVRGGSTKELNNGWQSVEFDGHLARVPVPTVLLKAKLADAAQIPQEGRNDVKHVKIMILVAREFILSVLNSLGNGRIEGRTAVDVLELSLQAISSEDARKCE